MLGANNILVGTNLRLTALSSVDLPIITAWYNDAGFLRLYDARPAYPKSEETLREDLEEGRKKADAFLFAARPVNGEELIGYVELDGILWPHRVAWLGLGIGERANWGKGYGREMLALALRFAFSELNLHRVQLTVFSYNERAIAMYEKAGFRREGVFREFMQRDGQRYDMYLYGLPSEEWESNAGL
jgi:RimJ/RimL family protein N-acetyltransferase